MALSGPVLAAPPKIFAVEGRHFLRDGEPHVIRSGEIHHPARCTAAPVTTRELGKGHVWINGDHLGRYGQIGSQQTLYVPGVWLKPGRNEVVVLEVEAGHGRSLQGLAAPVFSNPPDADRPRPKAGS